MSIPFSILNQSIVPYRVLTVSSWPTCRLVSLETGKVVWYSHLSKNFPWYVMIYTVKGFSIVNETEIDVSLKFPCFFHNPANVGNLIPSPFTFSKHSLDTWKFLVHIMLKTSMQDFKQDLTSMGDECNCLTVSTFLNTTLLGSCNEDWPFPVLWPLLGHPYFLT